MSQPVIRKLNTVPFSTSNVRTHIHELSHYLYAERSLNWLSLKLRTGLGSFI